MSTRDPHDPGTRDPRERGGASLDNLDDDFDVFAAALREQLMPVVTSPPRAAAIRTRAHAELRRASAPPRALARPQLLFLVQASTALTAGAAHVLWVFAQLWSR